MEIKEWKQIEANYKESLIIGNGASIAIDGRFRYDSIYQKIETLIPNSHEVQKVFDLLKTNDFEKVLKTLIQTGIINKTFNIESKKIDKAYSLCRNSLIEIIRTIHPNFSEIEFNVLYNTANFLRKFHTVISLNYDLLLYWIIYHGNKMPDPESDILVGVSSHFKDCFVENSINGKLFKKEYKVLRDPYKERSSSTLIFYLHGNLILADYFENSSKQEVKITSNNNDHLDVIYDKWNSSNYSPLFICEGSAKYKLESISKSIYLNTIYKDVFEELGTSIAIYGWDMSVEDEHILKRLIKRHKSIPINTIAVSVYKDGSEKQYLERISSEINKIDPAIKIDFYCSKSPNCWNN